MKYAKNLELILPEVANNKSVVYSLSGIEPTNNYLLPISSKPLEFSLLTKDDVSSFIADNIDMLDNPQYFMCVWESKGIFKVDICIEVPTKRSLVHRGILMGIGEVLTNNGVITLPAPQRAGTETQKAMYAEYKTNDILLGL